MRSFERPKPKLTSAVRASALVLAVLAPTGIDARAEVDKGSSAWVSAVVSKIADAETSSGGLEAGSVTIRVRIEADGTLADVGIDETSGSASLDERAIRAVRAAAPFKPPPAKLLTLEGLTELSFPLQLGAKRVR